MAYYPYSPRPAVPASGLSTAALVLGICGFFTCGLTSVLAVIFGHIGLGQTRNGQMTGRGQAVAGLVLGYIVLAPELLFLLFGLLGAVTLPFAFVTGGSQ